MYDGYWKLKVWNIFSFSRIQTYRIFYFLRRLFAKHQTLSSFSVAGLDRAKLGVYQFQSFLFIVVIVISILLKPTFWQISIYSQSLVKILKPDQKRIKLKNIGMAFEK